jgi:hypothetical protein
LLNLKEKSLTREMQTRVVEMRSHVDHALDLEISALDVLVSMLQSNPQLKKAMRSRDVETIRLQVDFWALSNQARFDLFQLHFYDQNFKSIYEHHESSLKHPAGFEQSLLAQAATERKTVSGIELNSTGTVFLMMAAPIISDDGLSGFVLLEKELTYLLVPGEDLASALSEKSYVLLLSKKYLDRGKWEHSMKQAGAVAQWGLLPNEVVLRQSLTKDIGKEAMHYLRTRDGATSASQIELAKRYFQLTTIPLYDVNQQEFGAILLFMMSINRSLGPS